MGKGASLGKEPVLADSGRAGEKSDFISILLAADDEEVARSNSRVGEVILRLERLDRDAKPFRYFSQRVSHADFIPARGPGGYKLSLCRTLWELVGRDAVKQLFHFRFRSHRNLQVVGLVAGGCRVSPQLRI